MIDISKQARPQPHALDLEGLHPLSPWSPGFLHRFLLHPTPKLSKFRSQIPELWKRRPPLAVRRTSQPCSEVTYGFREVLQENSLNRKSTPPVPERRRLEYAEAVKQQPIRQQNGAGSRNPEMVKPTYNWKSTTLEDGLFSGDPAASWTLEDEFRKSKQRWL